MMEILGTQMMGMPQGTRAAEGPHILPWPNGSILQARLVPGEGPPGSALLLIGGYRLRAEVPPNTPMGEVWLQIMGQQMPAQFRMMSAFQAHRLLMDMLRQHRAAASGEGDAATDMHGEDARQSHALPTSGSRFDGSGLHVTQGADANRWVIDDHANGEGGARGIIERQGDAEHFLLHGRIDLEQLGAVAFALEGGEDRPLRLRLFAADERLVDVLRPDFCEWLRGHAQLDGDLIAGLPVERGLQRDIVV